MRNEYNFSKAKRARDVSALSKLQADNKGKERITIRLDADVLDWYRAHMNEREGALERVLRKVIREELRAQ